MKTAQDSYTITIKQNVRFQERMHLEKFKDDKIKNGRLSAIIHLDRPDIAEYISHYSLSHGRYLVNHARWLDHYYKTKCVISGEDAFKKNSTR